MWREIEAEFDYLATEFGPVYNINSRVLAKHRYKAARGLKELSKSERAMYANAIEKAVLASQRTALARAVSIPRPNCASGTAHNNGADIHKAIRAQQSAALLNCPGIIRRARTPEQWAIMYADAMNGKR